MDTYHVLYNGKVVGNVEVRKEGLYYCFACRAALRTGMIYRLFLQCGNEEIDLGILVPQNHEFTTKKKLPINRLHEEGFCFIIKSIDECNRKITIEIVNNKPFPYIDKLQVARFQRCNGGAFVVIAEPSH